MNLIPNFSAFPYLIAGLVAAAGPVIIHLLNRRRYRTIQWAAMEFLREALRRNRRILQIRDLLLLALRTAVVLLFGLALAQPFFSPSVEQFDGTRPLHAVLLIDNSMSMGYETLEGSLLDRARQRARQFLDRLPADSRVSVIPICGSPNGYSPDAYTKEDAREALDSIRIVDRSASVRQAMNEASKACDAGPPLARRIVLFSDQQSSNWKDVRGADVFDRLPPVQIVDISTADWQNAWISDFRVQDGVADTETPTTFQVELRSQGADSRRDVQIRFLVDGLEVAGKTITLEPGPGVQEVTFEYLFNAYHPAPGEAISVPVSVSITNDRLALDDQRCLVVPVVAALPVVFVDQYGSGAESVVQKRMGETRHLRKLLAPVTSREDAKHQLVEIRHLKIEDLNQDVLRDARLVVVAGIADPGGQVPLLREYVEQGGQLMIAAGGDFDPAVGGGFDPARWTAAAWLDGAGILPAPLAEELVGATPEETTGELSPFFLDYDSLSFHQYFQLAGVGETTLRDLYAEPFFFKAVRVELSEENWQALETAERKRWEQVFSWHSSDPEDDGAPSGPSLGASRPRWLAWGMPGFYDTAALPEDELSAHEARLDELAHRARPRVLARFDDPGGTPFLVERTIGRGTVLFVSSGLLSDWNTLPKTNAMLIFDRILRSMMQSTLPARNFSAGQRITLPLASTDRDLTLTLKRPGNGSGTERLDPGFISREQLGVTLRDLSTRGHYTITATHPANGNGGEPETVWRIPLAVNGDAIESELAPLTREQFEQRVDTDVARWVGPDETISLAGSQLRGQNSWWWLILMVLLLLGLELALLMLPVWNPAAPARQPRAAT